MGKKECSYGPASLLLPNPYLSSLGCLEVCLCGFPARQPLPHCWTNSASACASPAGALVGSYTAATPECILFFSFLFSIFSNSISTLFLLSSSMLLSLRSWICLFSVSKFIRISLTSFSNHLCFYQYGSPLRASHPSPPLVFHHHLHLMAVPYYPYYPCLYMFSYCHPYFTHQFILCLLFFPFFATLGN